MKISVEGRVVDSRDTAIALIFESAEEKESVLQHLSAPIRSAFYFVPKNKDFGDVELFFSDTHFGMRSNYAVAA